MKYTTINVTLLLALKMSLLPAVVEAAYSPFSDPTSYLVQVNGKTYREKGTEERRAPASLTKVMTALLVLENCNLNEVVKVSGTAAMETGSRIGLRKGEKFKVKALLAATLMRSANDACRALADHVGGSQNKFVAMMNARAMKLGMKNTRFANACGHDQSGHYSTSHDLLLLTREALRNEAFAELVAIRSMRITTISGSRSFYIRNINRLIGNYPGAKGVKTGTTPNAGQCLIAFAERGETKVLLVILHSRNRWRSAPALLDAAFESYAPPKPAEDEDDDENDEEEE